MAKNSLKIVNANGSINEAGYIAVVDKIVLSDEGLDTFVGEDVDDRFTKARTRQLVKYATDGTNAVVQQLDEQDAPVDVTPKNCRIRAQLDVRKPDRRGFNKVTLSMPEEALVVGDLNYLDEYIEKFLQIRSGVALPAQTSPAAARNARKYMFGVLMLTKCR